MKNIFVLPTDQPSRLAFDIDDNFYLLCEEPVFFKHQELVENRSIYITSSEEIKEGVNQWYLDQFLNKPMNSGGAQYGEKQNVIILTTDPTLIADGIQSIDDEFLLWFVKNPTCEFVEIIYLGKFNKVDTYKIIIPQEGYICPHTKIQCDDECCVSAEYCHITSSLASGIVDCEEPKQDFTEEWKKLEDAKLCEPLKYWDETSEEELKLINWLQQSLTANQFYSTDAKDLIKQFKKKQYGRI